MPSYQGYCRSQLDCLILFEAACMGIIPRVSQRLSEDERSEIKSGSVYIWDENEAGVKRWTDGKSWSTSRVSGPFLIYRELESSNMSNSRCQVKPYGLCKQSASITINDNTKLHLIAYYKKEDVRSGTLIQPSIDMKLKEITQLLKKRNVGLMTPESGTPPPHSPPALIKPAGQRAYPVIVRQPTPPFPQAPMHTAAVAPVAVPPQPYSPPLYGANGTAYMMPIQRGPTPPLSTPKFMPQPIYEHKDAAQQVRVFDEDRRQLSLLDKSLSAY